MAYKGGRKPPPGDIRCGTLKTNAARPENTGPGGLLPQKRTGG